MDEINTNMFKEKCVNLIEVLKSALFFISGLYTVNPFQPSDAIWRHTFHLSLICMSFAQ
jgi:hypothetical protein